MALERSNVSRYHEHIPAALVLYTDEDSKKLRLKLLFSGNSLHSLASTINLVNNFQLKLLGNENDAIRTTNAPLHRNQTKISKADLEVYSMLLPMGMCSNQTRILWDKNYYFFHYHKIFQQYSSTSFSTFQCHSMRNEPSLRNCNRFRRVSTGSRCIYLMHLFI